MSQNSLTGTSLKQEGTDPSYKTGILGGEDFFVVYTFADLEDNKNGRCKSKPTITSWATFMQVALGGMPELFFNKRFDMAEKVKDIGGVFKKEDEAWEFYNSLNLRAEGE